MKYNSGGFCMPKSTSPISSMDKLKATGFVVLLSTVVGLIMAYIVGAPYIGPYLATHYASVGMIAASSHLGAFIGLLSGVGAGALLGLVIIGIVFGIILLRHHMKQKPEVKALTLKDGKTSKPDPIPSTMEENTEGFTPLDGKDNSTVKKGAIVNSVIPTEDSPTLSNTKID